MGGVASAAPAVHWFAGSGSALGFTSAAKLSLFVYNTIVSQLFLLVVSFGHLTLKYNFQRRMSRLEQR